MHKSKKEKITKSPEHIVPDFVHVLHEGKIVKSGSKELAIELEEKGYDWIKQAI